jgi:hypothetical protein
MSDDFPTRLELEANLDYITKRSQTLAEILDVLQSCHEQLTAFDIPLPASLTNMITFISEQLLISETEKQVFQADLAKEDWLSRVNLGVAH